MWFLLLDPRSLSSLFFIESMLVEFVIFVFVSASSISLLLIGLLYFFVL